MPPTLEIKELTKDERRKESQRSRQRRYYERNAAAIQERRKERYDPEQQATYYQENRDRIRSRHKEAYRIQRQILNTRRLIELLELCPDDLKNTIQKMIGGVSEGVINDRDVLAMEKAVILTMVGRNNGASDSKVDE
jgi:hypothetical protein